MRRTIKAFAGAAVALVLASQVADAQVLFWSTQAKPVEETQRMRDDVLAGFAGGVDYQPSDDGPWLTRLQAELEAGKGTIGVLGALHGSFASMPDDLVDLSGIDLGGQTVNPAYLELGTLGTAEQKYLPWMQATYIMAANKKALEFLPEGADINALTYDQLVAWAKATCRGDRLAEVRLPGGPRGAEAPVLPGLPAAVLRQLDGDEVPLRRGGGRLEHVPRPLAVHQPRLDRLRLHAAAAADRGGLDRLRPCRPAGRRLQPEAGRFRRLPGAGRAGRPRLHAGGGGDRDPAHRARHGGVAGARRLHDEAGDPDRDAAGDELLPGARRRGAARRHAELGEDVRAGDRRDDRGRAMPFRRCCRSASATSGASSTRSTPTPSSASSSAGRTCAACSTSRRRRSRA